MAKRSAQETYHKKRAIFLERVARILPTVDETLLSQSPQLSIRVNTLKSQRTYSHPIAWAPHCYWFNGGKTELTHSTAFTEGEIYLQNAASFIPPLVLDPQPGETILDMCTAPGGKASHIAALTNNQAELWVNDNSRPRLAKMQTNFTRLGVVPHSTTLFSIAQLGKQLPEEYFDKILLDAPCSGEGMLNINSPKDFTYWSVAHIKRLSSLQKQAVLTAWRLLKPGGLFVYSTCTMAPEENEIVVDYLLRRQPGASLRPISIQPANRLTTLSTWQDKPFSHDLSACLRLAPSRHIEAFFVAAVQKTAHKNSF